ncbi:ADP-ribose pyrophosphatase YjhB (NUDIX family) [Friedmanniella endophytica]|uniref:ADP-ribose pyrophosphatase YjhB (NUDIX family) n=1 Tax=Microlunatus kandeliicorticis TaxID=1759536 RepID=A0A7W3ISF5_9ACTN|nr:NUDIX domain-containing protein [Microlunatus kandeliicorticis]MBA8794408.1 ADP-ribose pyrophosphatase YjhB (NUDIX family) [Microlunatus kandeliicorticis]
MPTPPFVLALREVWGHRPLMLTGVVGVVHDAGQRVLLVRRADDGRWSLPAGILEPGEQPGAALARELAEEACVEVRVDRLAAVHADPVTTYPNGDQVQYLTLVFHATHLSGDPRPGDGEALEAGWFARDALPPMLDRELAGLDEGWERDGPTRFA